VTPTTITSGVRVSEITMVAAAVPVSTVCQGFLKY
jgi:hypothetical protein